MNEYAKEGKRFLNVIKEYFDEYGQKVGGAGNLFSRFSWDTHDTSSFMPNPNKLISGMSQIHCPDGYTVPLRKCEMPGFDVFFVIGDEEKGIGATELIVFISMSGAWQLTLLGVLSMHVMPLYWHANYMKWLPIFDDRSLRNLRDSHEKYSDDFSDSYSFIPDSVPTEPKVECLDGGHKYKVTFYVWSDFGGYLGVVTTVTFPKELQCVKVSDVKIDTEIETLYEYNCGVRF